MICDILRKDEFLGCTSAADDAAAEVADSEDVAMAAVLVSELANVGDPVNVDRFLA